MQEAEKNPNNRNLKMINETIYFFESYIENPKPIPEYLKSKCDIYYIYSSLAYLNECKENWDRAIYYLDAIKVYQMQPIPSDESLLKIYYMMLGTTSRRIGELKLKQGFDKAEEYYNKLKKDQLYKNKDFRNMVKSFIEKVDV